MQGGHDHHGEPPTAGLRLQGERRPGNQQGSRGDGNEGDCEIPRHQLLHEGEDLNFFISITDIIILPGWIRPEPEGEVQHTGGRLSLHPGDVRVHQANDDSRHGEPG